MKCRSYKLSTVKYFCCTSQIFAFVLCFGMGDGERGLRSSALDAVDDMVWGSCAAVTTERWGCVTQCVEIESACALRRQRFMVNDPRMKIYSVAIGTCSMRDDYNAVLHSYKRTEVLCKFEWIFRHQPSSEDSSRKSRSNFVAIRNFSGSFLFFIIE
jgi:hypothetical protein